MFQRFLKYCKCRKRKKIIRYLHYPMNEKWKWQSSSSAWNPTTWKKFLSEPTKFSQTVLSQPRRENTACDPSTEDGLTIPKIKLSTFTLNANQKHYLNDGDDEYGQFSLTRNNKSLGTKIKNFNLQTTQVSTSICQGRHYCGLGDVFHWIRRQNK